MLGNSGGCRRFLKGVIMAQCYSIILRFQGNGTRGSVEHPGSADLSRKMRSDASEVIGSVEQRMGMRNPAGTNGRGFDGQARQCRSESEGFSKRCAREPRGRLWPWKSSQNNVSTVS